MEVCCFQPHLISNFPRGKVLSVSFFMIQWAVLCTTRASFQASSRVVRQFSRTGRKVFSRGGYTQGSYSCSRENGETLVELWEMELW